MTTYNIALFFQFAAPLLHAAHTHFMNDEPDIALQFYKSGLAVGKRAIELKLEDSVCSGEKETEFHPTVLQRNIKFSDIIGMKVFVSIVADTSVRRNF